MKYILYCLLTRDDENECNTKAMHENILSILFMITRNLLERRQGEYNRGDRISSNIRTRRQYHLFSLDFIWPLYTSCYINVAYMFYFLRCLTINN